MKSCNHCKKVESLENFIKNEKELKNCNLCREKQKIQRDNNKCEHNRYKSVCKDCGGNFICEHGRQKSSCKECGGASICEHNRRKSICKECKGSQICVHDKVRSCCTECKGGSICEHNKRKTYCIECGGGSICEHKKRRDVCVDCDGNGICKHKIKKHFCSECGGSQLCSHLKRKNRCSICDPIGALYHVVSNRIRECLDSKINKTVEYLGCDIVFYKKFIEEKFKDGMSWENHGEWQIDHIIPVRYENPTMEDVVERLHFTNTQPLWKHENLSKGNRYIFKSEDNPEPSSDV